MTRSRQVLFAAVTVIGMTGVLLVGLVAVDMALHKRYEAMVGLNIRGYRGPVARRKRPGEQRVVVLGGSTAFGYGVPWQESFPAVLERQLNARRREQGRGPISVVNLAYNSEGAYAFWFTLRDYASLGYDAAIFYTGYNDLSPGNTYVFRQTSPIFKLTGYLPILPMICREKAMALRYGGNIEAGYRGEKTVFRPNLTQRATASALEAAVRISNSLDRQLGQLSSRSEPIAEATTPVACGEPWRAYCRSIERAVTLLLDRQKRVLIVDQPDITEAQADQQRALLAMLTERFGGNPAVQHVSLGKTVDVKDPSMAYDGMHLTASGNARIAEALVQPTLDLLQQ